MIWTIALFIVIASASFVSAQSNMNCDMYTGTTVPATDYVNLFNADSDDSHVQIPTLDDDYPYIFGCNSSIATLDFGCTGNAVTMLNLFRDNDSHVSVDGYYPNNLCFNTSTAGRSFYYDISLIGATPADYECAFAVAKMNDSHIYQCDNTNATYNINVKINSTIPPYSGCVDLDNESTYQDIVVKTTDYFDFNKNGSLCQKTYYLNHTSGLGIYRINASYLELDCNNSILIGNLTGTGFYVNGKDNVTLRRCHLNGYIPNVYVTGSDNLRLEDFEARNSTGYGIDIRYSDGVAVLNLSSYNNSYEGFYLQRGDYASLSGIVVNTSRDGMRFDYANHSTLSGSSSSNNSDTGIRLQFSRNFTFTDVDSYMNTQIGYTFASSTNVTVIGAESYLNYDSGMAILSQNVTVTDSEVHDNALGVWQYGIYMNAANNSRFHNVSISHNDVFGLYVANSYHGVFTNNTFNNHSYGVYLSSSSNNTFYYNNFNDSSTLHAWTNVAGNHFNRTNSTKAPGYRAEGNYWDDILTLDILDLNGDGFGETGTDYPYDSANGGHVSANVQDSGPITTKGCTDLDGDGFYPYTASPACPGTYRDCNDNNPNILPPYDGLSPTVDTILCNGTYYVSDLGNDGVVNYGADGVNISCNDTLLVGTWPGIGFHGDHVNNSILQGCNVSNYSTNVLFEYSNHTLIDDVVVSNNTGNPGVYSNGGNYVNVTNLRAYSSGTDGVKLFGGQYAYLSNITVFNVGGVAGLNVVFDYATIVDVEAHDCYRGVWFGGLFTNASRINVTNSTVQCILAGGLKNGTLEDSTISDCPWYSLKVDGTHNSTFRNISIYDSNYSGMELYVSDNNDLIDIDIDMTLRDGVYLRRSNYTYFEDVYINDSNVSVRFYQSNSSTVRNSTFRNGMYGVYLDESIDNIFYFNNFLDSSFLDAYAAAAGNFFNTTNGSNCGANCSRGNYWDDILTLDIYDTNATGFGDWGPDYPYNAANGGNVSANVQDEGPITNKPPPTITDTTDPTGSIEIWGYNGTEITGSRNVFLNLTFADETSICGCRWANADPANLDSMAWENCTTVKPWILNETEGNQTVYYQITDCAGNNITLDDSIIYRFMQDFTPPTSPIVYDSDYGYDVDWWNDNTSISAYWWNATDDISTLYYRYRLLNDSDCYVSGCPWTDVGIDDSVTVESLSLQEGWNVSFEVQAYTASGWNSTNVTSNGSIIDLTKPNLPFINSSTHPVQGITYSNGTVKLNFTATDPISNSVSSGIAGYSYIIDEHPGTAPDDNMEARYWERLSEKVNDGYAQLLRANSTAPSPHTYAIYGQLHDNFTNGDIMKVRVAMAEIGSDFDDEMRVKAYLVSVADGAGLGAFTFDMEGSAITTISNVSRDVRYSEDLKSATVYEFDVQVTSTTSDSANDIYVVVAGVPGDNDNRNNLSIAGSTSEIDNSTKLFICNNTPNCGEYTNVLDMAIEVKRQDDGSIWDVKYEDLQDGEYYFHVKARDVAGNWGDTGHYNISIDTAGVRVDIISPFSGQLFASENITAIVEVNDLANVTVYVDHPDGSQNYSAWSVFTGTDMFNISLENGTNRIYAVAINPVNNVTTYSQSVYVLLGTDVADSNKTLRVAYGGGLACAGHVCETNEGGATGVTLGIATENDAASIGGGTITADTGRQTIKIFATNPAGLGSAVESDLSDDDFLDRVNPMFGYTRGVPYYIIRTETRSENIYLDGDQHISSGKYTLVFRNVGETPDGRTNITVRIA